MSSDAHGATSSRRSRPASSLSPGEPEPVADRRRAGPILHRCSASSWPRIWVCPRRRRRGGPRAEHDVPVVALRHQGKPDARACTPRWCAWACATAAHLDLVPEVMFFVGVLLGLFELPAVPGDAGQRPAGVAAVDDPHLRSVHVPILNTMILLLSGTTVTWAHQCVVGTRPEGAGLGPRPDHPARHRFTMCEAIEYSDAPFHFSGGGIIRRSSSWRPASTASMCRGTCFRIVRWFRARAGHFTPERHFGFEAAAWYRHFVDVVWLFLFVCTTGTVPARFFRWLTGPAAEYPPVSVLRRRCAVAVRAAEGKLFQGVLTVRERCLICGLDLRVHDTGDGPAVGVILVLGAIVVSPRSGWNSISLHRSGARGAVAGRDTTRRDPVTRPMKAALVALQYQHRKTEMGLRSRAPAA